LQTSKQTPPACFSATLSPWRDNNYRAAPARKRRLTAADRRLQFSQAESGRQARLDVRTFGLLNRFIDEVHRLYPAEFLLTRQAIDTHRLPSGLLVRRGHRVMINLNCLHRNASVFANPNRFDPDRFKNGAVKASGSYLPFGAGITTCLGVSLARLIIAMSLHAMLSKWHVKSLDNTIALDSRNCFSVTAQGPVMVQLQPRDTARRLPLTAARTAAGCPHNAAR
jgi:cytochrome P450